MENNKVIWVLHETYDNGWEIDINTFSTYEKAKEKFNYVLSIRKENWWLDGEKGKDYELGNNYCRNEMAGAELELFASELDSFHDFSK